MPAWLPMAIKQKKAVSENLCMHQICLPVLTHLGTFLNWMEFMCTKNTHIQFEVLILLISVTL